jgi:hypothetical protein
MTAPSGYKLASMLVVAQLMSTGLVMASEAAIAPPIIPGAQETPAQDAYFEKRCSLEALRPRSIRGYRIETSELNQDARFGLIWRAKLSPQDNQKSMPAISVICWKRDKDPLNVSYQVGEGKP